MAAVLAAAAPWVAVSGRSTLPAESGADFHSSLLQIYHWTGEGRRHQTAGGSLIHYAHGISCSGTPIAEWMPWKSLEVPAIWIRGPARAQWTTTLVN
mmetsp:Transcript_71813/g.186491  ORF Transcript_71813/g.186491 Transcript_71813/m.186491 type:complete len:97 (+) Transcript_71813:637-927(+)